MLDINDLKKTGVIINYENQPYQIIKSQHTHVARGGASLRAKLKNLITGQTLERVFTSSDKIISADIERSKANFLYAEGNKYYFMDNRSYEQFFLESKILAGQEKFLKEGLTVDVLLFNQSPVNIELPKKIDLKVSEAPPGIKGDSATTPTKNITLETGLKIIVPIFIKTGDIIKINTETGEYVGRV